MKVTTVFLFAVSWATAAPKTVLEGNVSKSSTFNSSTFQGQYGLVFAKKTTIEKYPYNVAVLRADNVLLGGGMIYKDQWIITGGSISTRTVSNITIRAGSTNALEGGQLLNVSKVFSPPLNENCMSLLKLDKKINFGKTAKSIAIAKHSRYLRGRGDVTGYGQTAIPGYDNQLQRRRTELYDRDTCRDNWWTFIGPRMGPMQMCATSVSCYGDEGDPLVQKGKAVGLFMYSVDCADDAIPVIFCDLTKLRKWIDLTIRNDKASHSVSSGDHWFSDALHQ